MKLAIISHTEHYKTPTGELVGWGATVNEINHLLEVFDEVYHVAMLHQGEAPASALPYVSKRVHVVPIPAVGGKRLVDKMTILWKAPKVIQVVSQVLKQVDVFQLRTPTGIGLFLIPYLTWFTKQKGWYKYAGNWNQHHPPLGYRLQRLMLRLQKRKVTINGFWPHQPPHHVSFENPCLTDEDIQIGEQIRRQKQFNAPLSFCFVGRLEREKGVERIIRAFLNLNDAEQSRVGQVHLVGDGAEASYFKALAASGSIPFVFHGGLPKADVVKVYQQCHVFLLPTTASEGFPKVIAEAMNFGCVPVVSNLSSIGHYIKPGQQGYLLDVVTTEALERLLKKLLYLCEHDYRVLLEQVPQMVKLFTFTHYNHRIATELLNIKTIGAKT